MTYWRIRMGLGYRLSTILIVVALGLTLANGPAPAQDAPAPSGPTTVPLRPPPSPRERLLSPVPQQFDWMRRISPANPLLESLVDPQRVKSRLSFSLTLSGEYSDNYEGSVDVTGDEESQNNIRAALTLGTLYHRERLVAERTHSFVSLANTISADYDDAEGNAEIGFTNLSLNTGYNWSRISFALSDSLVLDDDQFRFTQGLESERRRFLSNSLSPQVRYAFSRRSSTTLGYTNEVVVDLEDSELDAVTHSLTLGFQYRFSRAVDSNVSYSAVYLDRRLEGEDELSHNIAASLGWGLSTRTSLLFSLNLLLEDDSETIQLSTGVRQQLSSHWSFFISVGPSYVSRTTEGDGSESQDREQDFFVNWEASLSGQIASQTSLALTTSQGIDNTSGDVADRGLVLRTAAGAALNHAFTPNLRSTVSINYGRNDLLENRTPDDVSESNEEQFVIAGLSAVYVFTSTLSLSLSYEYEQRFSDTDEDDFLENRVTLALSTSF